MDITIQVRGESPMLMNNSRTADPLNPYARKLRGLTSKRKKTDEDHEDISRLEFEARMYCDEAGPFLPADNFHAALKKGGGLSKKGAQIDRSLIITDDVLRLAYKGPREPDAMYETGQFTDRRSVVVARQRTMRTRPIFIEWAFDANAVLDEAGMDLGDLCQVVEDTGIKIGLGDFRPRYGRFSAEVVERS